MNDDYGDIIDHPHYQSNTRPHMSMINRAAQFSPFAALTGYDESVEEAGRLTDDKIIIDEEMIRHINDQLKRIENGDKLVTITYFISDALKEGGSYTIISGEVKKIDPVESKIHMTDGSVIPIDDVFDISIR